MSRGHSWFIPDSDARIPGTLIHRDGSAREDARSAWLRSTRLCEGWRGVETERRDPGAAKSVPSIPGSEVVMKIPINVAV